MDTVFTGRIWKLPDDVDTDTIIPGRYGVLPSAEEMSRHCLEPLRPELAAAARPGDIFVAGKNFGCGSSREFAPACIAALGVRCIVGIIDTFRIFLSTKATVRLTPSIVIEPL